MFYQDGNEIEEDLKNGICPYCRCKILDKDATECRVCERSLVNFCSKCHRIGPSNARFCEHCGSMTSFYWQRILFSFDSHYSPEKIEQIRAERFANYKRFDMCSWDDEDIRIYYLHAAKKNGLDLENAMVIDSLWDDGY
jgi:RNA polymerase subunit RPABC4/transcription elongation factor Spt4